MASTAPMSPRAARTARGIAGSDFADVLLRASAFSRVVATGRASAFVMDEILLAGLVASAPDPNEYSISREALSQPEPYGIVMPPGDRLFKDAFNREMLQLFENGDMVRLYDRWFTQPMPPDGRNMKLPLSDDMKAVFAAPRLFEH